MLRGALISQWTWRNLLIVLSVISLFGLYNFRGHLAPIRVKLSSLQSSISHSHSNATQEAPGEPLLLTPPDAVSCIGPRGKRIDESPDDQIRFHKFDGNPPTFAGSYDALGLDSQWSTADERYGPYGYKQDAGNARKSINWAKVDWGKLQAQCFRENAHRFSEHGQKVFNASEIRLRLRTPEDDTSSDGWLRSKEEVEEDGENEKRDVQGVPMLGKIRHHGSVSGRELFPKPEEVVVQRTNRTLLVLRTYENRKYTEEDKINIRSLISEAALQSGGSYTVMLLVNIKDDNAAIFEDERHYWAAFEKALIPEEFRSIAVLWDEQLLQSWYPKVEDHTIMFQINQAFQLLAVFYPEFEHFWQLEIDIRSLGHHLPLLDGLDSFGRAAPRKQQIERASFLHVPDQQGPYYPDFLHQVNGSLNGSSKLWGPVQIPEIPNPVGPKPPVSRADDDDFTWGVGEPADLIVTSPCSWVSRMHNWPFQGWIEGPFIKKGETPRLACPPATQRASRTLLLAVHAAQMALGLAVPSEATLPSFAMWHGLKLSFPPMPYFQNKKNQLEPRTMDVFYNGGRPGECIRMAQPLPSSSKAAQEIADDVAAWLNDTAADPATQQWLQNGSAPITVPWKDRPWRAEYQGFACGEAFINQWPRDAWTRGISWWWISSFPRRVLDVWTAGGFDEGVALHDAEGEQRQIEDALRLGKTAEWERLVAKKKWDEEREVAVVLKKVEDKWYAPAGWWHPAKSKTK